MTKAEEGEKLYIAGAKYREIAEKCGVSIDTVKSWKKRRNWMRTDKNKEDTQKKGCTQKPKKGAPQKEGAEPKDREKDPAEIPEGEDLKNQHKEFCVYFVKSYNATKAYQKVYGCSYYAAAVSANKLLKNAKIREYIRELQSARAARMMITKEDVIQRYADIAYADISDFAEVKKGKLRWKDTEEIDGTLVSGIRETEHGLEIKTPTISDRIKALGELNKLFEEQQPQGDEENKSGGIGVFNSLEGEE